MNFLQIIVTIERNINFITDVNNSDKNIGNRGLAIKTLRLIKLDGKSLTDICDSKTWIQLCNLDNTLKNLTIESEVDSHCERVISGWTKTIDNILTKEFYYNLTNVNILLTVHSNIGIDSIICILKSN